MATLFIGNSLAGNTPELIREVLRPLWENMAKENPDAFHLNDKGEQFIPHGIEEFTFNDFVDEVRIELIEADKRN